METLFCETMPTVRGVCNVCSTNVTTEHRGRVKSKNGKYVHAKCWKKLTLRLCRECNFLWMSSYNSYFCSEFWPSDWAMVAGEVDEICADCGSKYDSFITKKNTDLIQI